MRHVGKAVKGHTVMSRGAMLTDKTSQVHLIGIAPWGIVEHRSELIGKVRSILRVSPWMHQAGVLHAISPISMKLGQFKGSTPKLKMTNWFVVWIFMVGDSPPNWFN